MTPEIAMSEQDSETDPESGREDHLAELEDGAGCAEIWEHLSDRRKSDDD